VKSRRKIPWRKTAKGKAYFRAYEKYPKRRAYKRAYDKSPKRRAYKRAYLRVYNKSPKRRAYEKSPKRRDYKRALGHQRRARIKGNGGSWKPAEFKALCAKYKHRCMHCGKRRKMTAEHIVPIVKGGRNVIGNLQPLCQPCNSSKGARTIDYRKNPHPNCL
jgi:5-methylcytosine-specific restriction endonuclease McrA